MRTRLARLGSAHAVAFIALFVALGGTGYAVSKLPKNSVGTEQVRDGSLQARDLAADALRAGPRGPRGPQGPAGAQGPATHATVRMANLFNAQVALSSQAWQDKTVLRIPNVPAGTYLVNFAGELNGDVALADPVPVWCEVVALGIDNADESKAQRISIMAASGGHVAGGNAVESMGDFGTFTSASPFNVWVRCHPGAPTGSPFVVAHARLAVTPVDSVVDVPQ